MKKIVVLGSARDYRAISTHLEAISYGFSEMHGNLNPSKLIEKLESEECIPAKTCENYGGTTHLDITGRTDNLLTDVADFFEQAREYGDKHGADYVLIQDFKFEIGGRASRKISASLQLLLEEKL